MHKEVFPKEVKKFIEENVKGHYNKELISLIEEEFGITYTLMQIQNYKKNHKLHSGIDPKFKKGHKALNGFKKGHLPEASKKTRFGKGEDHPLCKPIGAERNRVCAGRTYIQVKADLPNKWRFKHIVEWEKHHGAVPKGHVILFLDNDTTNCSIDNLAIITRREMLIMCKQGLKTQDKDLTETGVLIAKVISRNMELSKGEG